MGKSEEGSSGPTFAGCPVESLGFGDLAKQEVPGRLLFTAPSPNAFPSLNIISNPGKIAPKTVLAALMLLAQGERSSGGLTYGRGQRRASVCAAGRWAEPRTHRLAGLPPPCDSCQELAGWLRDE